MSDLAELRAAGWRVAVHNDYRINGSDHTFWLMTHPCGRWIKGEGASDEQALSQCLSQMNYDDLIGTVEAHIAAVEAKAAHDAAIRAAIKALRIWTGHDSGPNIRHHFGERWWEPIDETRRALERLIEPTP